MTCRAVLIVDKNYSTCYFDGQFRSNDGQTIIMYGYLDAI